MTEKLKFVLGSEIMSLWKKEKMLVTRILTFSRNVYTLASKKRGYTVLALSVFLSVTTIFHRIFLGNHASQPFQTWYGALARGPTLGLLNFFPPLIYLLFPGSVHFWRSASWDGGVYTQ